MKVEELSDYVGINRSYFSDLFKQYTGMSPVKYLQNFRITKAQHMLTISELSIESIAFSCGYQSAEAFHKIFRKTHRHVAQCLPPGKAPENALQSGDHEQ